jgi:hypothetical protein
VEVGCHARHRKNELSDPIGWARGCLYYELIRSGALPVPARDSLAELIWIHIFNRKQRTEYHSVISNLVTSESSTEYVNSIRAVLREDYIPGSGDFEKKKVADAEKFLNDVFAQGPIVLRGSSRKKRRKS